MLKLSNDEEISVFTNRVLNFINPKFNDTNEIELAKVEIYSFASKCELTANEFLLALELAADKKLFSEPDGNGESKIIQLYREIDRLKLGEVKAAYLHYKSVDKQYETGKAQIKAFLEQPAPEPTPEELKEQFIKFLKEEYSRLQQRGEILGSIRFYDLLRKEQKQVNLAFVEKFISEYKPKTFQEEKRSLETHLASSKKIIKKDLFLSFKELYVSKVFEKEKMKDKTLDEFIEYWIRYYEAGNEKPDRSL